MNSITPTPSSAYHLYLGRASRSQLAALVSSASAVLAAEAAQTVDSAQVSLRQKLNIAAAAA